MGILKFFECDCGLPCIDRLFEQWIQIARSAEHLFSVAKGDSKKSALGRKQIVDDSLHNNDA